MIFIIFTSFESKFASYPWSHIRPIDIRASDVRFGNMCANVASFGRLFQFMLAMWDDVIDCPFGSFTWIGCGDGILVVVLLLSFK